MNHSIKGCLSEQNKPLFQAFRLVGHLPLAYVRTYLTELELDELLLRGFIQKESGVYRYKRFDGYYLTGTGIDLVGKQYQWEHFYRRQGLIHDLSLAKLFFLLSEAEQARALTQPELALILVTLPEQLQYTWANEHRCPDFGCLMDNESFKCFKVYGLKVEDTVRWQTEWIADQLGGTLVSRSIHLI